MTRICFMFSFTFNSLSTNGQNYCFIAFFSCSVHVLAIYLHEFISQGCRRRKAPSLLTWFFYIFTIFIFNTNHYYLIASPVHCSGRFLINLTERSTHNRETNPQVLGVFGSLIFMIFYHLITLYADLKVHNYDQQLREQTLCYYLNYIRTDAFVYCTILLQVSSTLLN